MTIGHEGDPELGADAVRGRHQHGPPGADAREIEEPAEAADASHEAGPGGLAGHGRDGADEAIGPFHVHAGVLVGELRHGWLTRDSDAGTLLLPLPLEHLQGSTRGFLLGLLLAPAFPLAYQGGLLHGSPSRSTGHGSDRIPAPAGRWAERGRGAD